ncbi:MAG: hypothetical protein JSS81_15590 [Acidobacteria bacterium]|nr:hypothetical protein [Acidobacteriota bacterium]
MKKPNRLNRTVLNEDHEAFRSLLAIRDYHPQIAEFGLAEVTAVRDALEAAQNDRAQKDAAFEAAKDAEEAAEHRFHEAILGVKDQVRSQYGASSDQYASLGLKKRNEYARGRRRTAKTRSNPI